LDFVRTFVPVEELIWYYESIKLDFCWLKPISNIVESRNDELSSDISSEKALHRKVLGDRYECHFFYPFGCDNPVIEGERMEGLEIKRNVLCSAEICWDSTRALCQLCWLSW
jgi:hypothetical protein